MEIVNHVELSGVTKKVGSPQSKFCQLNKSPEWKEWKVITNASQIEDRDYLNVVQK